MPTPRPDSPARAFGKVDRNAFPLFPSVYPARGSGPGLRRSALAHRLPTAELAREVADKGWIIYSAGPTMAWDLFTRRGSIIRRVTQTFDYEERRYSPDGARILYGFPESSVIDTTNGASGPVVIAVRTDPIPRIRGEENPGRTGCPMATFPASTAKASDYPPGIGEVVKEMPRRDLPAAVPVAGWPVVLRHGQCRPAAWNIVSTRIRAKPRRFTSSELYAGLVPGFAASSIPPVHRIKRSKAGACNSGWRARTDRASCRSDDAYPSTAGWYRRTGPMCSSPNRSRMAAARKRRRADVPHAPGRRARRGGTSAELRQKHPDVKDAPVVRFPGLGAGLDLCGSGN